MLAADQQPWDWREAQGMTMMKIRKGGDEYMHVPAVFLKWGLTVLLEFPHRLASQPTIV
jgi:hypothetical protein